MLSIKVCTTLQSQLYDPNVVSQHPSKLPVRLVQTCENISTNVHPPSTLRSVQKQLHFNVSSTAQSKLEMTSPDVPFPVPNSTEAFWRTQLDPLDSHRTTGALPSKADIVVIGAGYAGASTVYHVLEKSNDSAHKPSIVILEAREASSGATGRNGAIYSPKPSPLEGN